MIFWYCFADLTLFPSKTNIFVTGKNCTFSKKGLGHKGRCYSVCIDDTCKWISHILSRIIGPSNTATKIRVSISANIYCKPWNFDQLSRMFMKNWYVFMKIDACSCKIYSCSCKIYAWIFKVQVSKYQPVSCSNWQFQLTWGVNKRSCSTVCTAFTIKMFLVIIVEQLALLTVVTNWSLSYFYNNHMTLKLKMIIIGNEKNCQIFSLDISLKISFWCET